ncbi:10835_t:CDS:2 [Entrophospora sp. SA101]|nr:10835_t:CDS:2 [Entrophospora sp. SA101]
MDDVVIPIFEKISNIAAKAYEAYKNRKIKEKFRDKDSIDNLQRYVNAVTNRIIEKIKRHDDETINYLNLDVSLENLETVENLYGLVEEGFNDVSQATASMKNNMDNNMVFLMEMVAGVNKSIKELSNKTDQSDFKKVQPVACKPFEASTNEKDKELFNGYLTILSNLQHSNSVIAFYGVELGSLKEVYEKNPVITWKEKLKIAHDICLGLQFIHECQLFHCDVRCENILVMGPGLATPKFTNFFPSRKQMDISKKIPPLNDIMPWMAPEKPDLRGRYTPNMRFIALVCFYGSLHFNKFHIW